MINLAIVGSVAVAKDEDTGNNPPCGENNTVLHLK
jgi:hypothetical protein